MRTERAIDHFSNATGLDLALSTIEDGNMHPNLEPEAERHMAQERFNAYCLRHGFDPTQTAGMRVDPKLTEIADIVRTSVLAQSEIGTVDPLLRRSASGLIVDSPGSAGFTLVGDCYPVVVASSGSPEFAILHVNWRAVEAGIGALALDALGLDPQSASVYVGPGISREFNWHSALSLPRQVNDPAWKDFVSYFEQHPVIGGAGITLDLLGKFLRDLKNSGIGESRIYVDERDTSDPHLYSRRQSLNLGDKPRGNNALIVKRRESE